MELVIAAIGLSLGILSPAAYAMLVLIAVVTSMMAGPMLRASLARAEILGSDGTADVVEGMTRAEAPVVDGSDTPLTGSDLDVPE